MARVRPVWLCTVTKVAADRDAAARPMAARGRSRAAILGMALPRQVSVNMARAGPGFPE
jgi:hypothetical protein